MKQLNDINEFERYIYLQKKVDKILIICFVMFMLMALVIAYYAIENQSINKEMIRLQDQRQKYLQEKNILVDSLKKEHNAYIDSIKLSIVNTLSIKDTSIVLLEKQNKSLLEIVKSKKAVSSRNVANIQRTNSRVSTVVKNSKAKTNETLMKSFEYRSMNNIKTRYTVYIQYTTQRKSLADQYYQTGLRQPSFTMVKPELINYNFSSVVRYFHDSDRSKAEEIGNRIRLPVEKTSAKYNIPMGQIEVWLGQFND